jgi:uncharacterized protein
MTRIIALSDTHLENDLPEKIVDLVKDADLILHAGDFVELEVYDSLADIGRIEAVCGNADGPELRRILPERRIIDVEGTRIGLVHQAAHVLGPGVELLAREMDVDILIFGHLHRPYVQKGEKLLICPGSPTVPRMSPPSVAEIEVQDGKIRGKIVPIGEPLCDYIKYAESLAKKDL